MDKPIYLDYAATTPVDQRVAAVLQQYLTKGGIFGNASSRHVFGKAAANAVNTAREQVAHLLGASDPSEIIWTSGATESNNLAICGIMRSFKNKNKHLITLKTEHKSILDTCRVLEKNGYIVNYLDTDPTGLADIDRIIDAIRPNTVMISIMHVNNETGVIQDIETISQITQERGILLHVDAAQSVGKIPINLKHLPIDLLSLSAHKIYGPKGIGALFLRYHLPQTRKIRIEPILYGGGQERGLRAGTIPVHQVIAAGEACRIAEMEMSREQIRLKELRDIFLSVLSKLGQVILNGHPEKHWPGIINLTFKGITAEAILTAIPEIAVTTGAACTSAHMVESHVLRAMHCDSYCIRGALRFSFGRFTTIEEINYATSIISTAVNHLRTISPLWDMQICNTQSLPVDWSIL